MCSGRGQLLPKMSLRNTVRSYCVICKRDFPCSARLTRHWNSVHTGKRRRFITETKFNKLVPNSKKRCDICNIIFYSDFSKKRHDRWHSKNKLACEVAAEQDEIVAEIDEIVKKLNAEEANAEIVEPEAVAEPIAEPAEVVAKKESNKKVKKVITNPSAETVDTAAEKPTEAPARKARDVEKTVKSVKKSTKHNVATTEIVEKAAAKKESARKKATVAKENDRKVEKKAEQHYELRISHFPFIFGWYHVASSDSCPASEKTL